MHKHFWKRKVDNRMRDYGDLDEKTGIIRVNKSKKKNKRGDILDTIVHEELHRKHLRMTEKNVQKKTKATIPRLSRKQKQSFYNKYK